MIATFRCLRRSPVLVGLLASASLLAAPVDARSHKQTATAEAEAVPAPQPTAPAKIIAVPIPLPLPGQMKLVEPDRRVLDPRDPRLRIGRANASARVQPDHASWLNAIQQYAYADGALYQVYAAPGQITDIALQPGEELVGDGPVAAGDTVRWIIGDTISGSGSGSASAPGSGTGEAKRVHILVKPTRGDIATNLVINTDRRTYHLELRATPATYMAAVSWTYPADALIALRRARTEQSRIMPVAGGIDLAALDFRYGIEGDKPAWRPVRAFDDGRQVFIEFPASIATVEMPPLFVTGADGAAELVNYRVQGRYMVIDRLFASAELRLGTMKSMAVVRIIRGDARKGKRS